MLDDSIDKIGEGVLVRVRRIDSQVLDLRKILVRIRSHVYRADTESPDISEDDPERVLDRIGAEVVEGEDVFAEPEAGGYLFGARFNGFDEVQPSRHAKMDTQPHVLAVERNVFAFALCANQASLHLVHTHAVIAINREVPIREVLVLLAESISNLSMNRLAFWKFGQLSPRESMLIG